MRRTLHITNRNSQVVFKFGLFGPRLTYYSNPTLFDTITISLFFVMIYIRYNIPKKLSIPHGNYGFYCMSKPDEFIVEWQNYLIKRFHMPWNRTLIERSVKSFNNEIITKPEYITLHKPDIDTLFSTVDANKDLYLKNTKILGVEFEYFVSKNRYRHNLFKNTSRYDKIHYEVFVNILTPVINDSFLIFEVKSDDDIVRDIGTEILTRFFEKQYKE